MRRASWMAVALAAAVMVYGVPAMWGTGPGPVKISAMTRVESHSKVINSAGEFGGESYAYAMISLFRELQPGTFGSVFYMNRFSIDESEVASHIGGVSVTQVFSPKALGTLGYTHTTNPEQGTVVALPSTNRDRMSATVVYNFNPKAKSGPLYSLTSSFSSVTDFGEQQTLSEKLGARFPKITKYIEGDLGYTYSYSLKESDQMTNQFNGSLTYKLSAVTKVTLGALYIDNVYQGNMGDDTVGRLTLTRSFR